METMLNWTNNLKEFTNLRWKKLHKFKPKISISIDFGPYLLKTVTSKDELLGCFKLRHKVFYNEFQEITDSGIDTDHFDYLCDHLIIIHKESNSIVGTYRLRLFYQFADSYTGLEFKLHELFKMNGPFLELGRACINKNHRRGSVITLLWRGIAQYMNASGANILFGCSSIKIDNPRDAALVYKYLCETGNVSTEIQCSPTNSFKMYDFDVWYTYFKVGLSEKHNKEAESLMPSLLKSYLKLGAKVLSEPAFDKNFNCIDMLTVLNKSELQNSLARKFQVNL